MDKAKAYRCNAVECRALAASAKTERIRTEMLMIAEIWERLAADRELIKALRKNMGG